MYNLNEKKVLITGATGGIGRAIVKAFLDNGAIVLASGTSDEKLENLKNELNHKNLNVLKCDLSNKIEAENLPSKANTILSGLDVVICNAGITKDQLSMRMSADDFSSVLDVNLIANFLINKTSATIMRKAKTQGAIINMASIIGLIGNVGQANYAASKAGLIGMTKSLAREYAKSGITFNCVAPGFIETEMTAKIPQNILEEMLKNVPMQRQGKPEEVAKAVLFLANSSYITGETLNINGGLLMN